MNRAEVLHARSLAQLEKALGFGMTPGRNEMV
jgi:hypothetical protein